MSLTICPLQDICPRYANGTTDRSNYTRMLHPCNEFLGASCEMGAQTEMFIRMELGEEVACSIEKHNKG